MEVFEITGFEAGVSKAGVNFLQPSDSFQNIENGFIYRQVLQSRQGIGYFAPRLAGETRILGIFEHTLPDSTKELLGFDRNFLYKYNIGTGVFDQIPFAGTMAAYAGFNITANDLYISGTSYPTATNQPRFVFTGEGITANAAGSAVFFYNGTDVRDFTAVADNADYAAPPQGPLVRAIYVLWFGERLNFVVPTINVAAVGVTQFNQGVLYSGIRTTAGNGDKFNVAGSGLLQLDTYENITGAYILGQVIALNADRSNWVLEKTRDAFNPYFSRKIPSVLGTNAKFSGALWNDTVRSIGKTGIIGTDNRQSLRVDNKIPYFTADEIDQIDFNLTYGGFDRINNQFLWSYKESETDTETQNQVLVNNYEENTWSVFDLRLTVFGQTDLGLNLTWDDIDEASGNESWAQWDTTEEAWDKIGLGKSVQKTLAGDDLGFIYDLNDDFDDYYTSITAITQAAQAVVTVAASGFQPGDRVVIQSVAGMTQINNYDPDLEIDDDDYADSIINFQPYTVVSATPTSVTLNVDSTLFTAATPNTGSLSKVINFSAETIPFNPYRSLGRKCYISHVEFLIDVTGGYLKVDVFQDEDESPYKENILLLPTNNQAARQWISMSVDNEANFHTFVLKQESPAVQLKITSIRIHSAPGGFTNA